MDATKNEYIKKKWDWDYDATTGDQASVLEDMRSHKRLKKLSINYYGNIEFPNWSGEHSYGNVVMIRLKSCKKISSLPPLVLGSVPNS